MPVRVNIQGEIFPPEQAKISVFDRQFLYGDGVFETLRTAGGRPFLTAPHLRRLRKSAAGIALRIPWSDDALLHQISRTLDAAENEESAVRVLISRGEGAFGLDPTSIDDSRLVIMVRPLAGAIPENADQGVDVAIPSARRFASQALYGYIKTGDYLNQAMALAEGRRRGAFEVILLNERGFVTEGSTSNVFFMKDGKLCTPALESGVLPGVTRAAVLGLATESGISTSRRNFDVSELLSADEAFLTSTLKAILPIRRCDEKPIGSHVPGPVTRRLLAAYLDLMRDVGSCSVNQERVEALIRSGDGENR